MTMPLLTPARAETSKHGHCAVASGWAFPRSGRVIAHFSCGGASACATKLAIAKYPDLEIYYTDPGSEHPDNVRFLRDCERWFGKYVRVLKSDKYANIDEVFMDKRFLVSHQGAPCTGEMKKIPGNAVTAIGEVEIFGYTVEEKHRVARWKDNNPERIIECPLIEKGMDKADCLGMLERVGITLPTMYKLGFRNNNCIGCVKARDNLDYWKRVRLHFPEVFARRARQERELNITINRVTKDGVRSEIYLDEIEAGDPKGADPQISCGLFCMAEADAFTPNTDSATRR